MLNFSSSFAEKVEVAVPSEYTSVPNGGGYPYPDRFGDIRFFPRPLTNSAELATIVQPKLGVEVAMASAAAIGSDELLIATYQNIFSLNIRSGNLRLLTIDASQVPGTKIVPTGVAVGQHSGSVFIANYLANNILIGHISADVLKIDRQISGPGVISPENVALSSDEQWLVSANFDGSTATGFKSESGEFVQKWTTEVSLAHGVAVLRDRVFVSSLTLRKILVLNLSDGSLIGSFGQPGWQAYCLDFLWPTGLQAIDDDLIVVTDAHTGGVYRISFVGETGQLIDVSGGTAPGPFGLQMPYASARIGDNLAILSTFSPKIILVGSVRDPRPLDVKELIIEQPQQGGPSPSATNLPLGVGWNGYTHMAEPEFKISGIDMVPAYGALVSLSRARPMQIENTFYINPHSLGLLRGLMYFVEAHVLQSGVVLSSPSVNYALYITTGRSSCIAKVELPAPPLATEQGLRHSFGTTVYEDIERAALQRFKEADRTRGPNELLERTQFGSGARNPRSFGCRRDPDQ
jgi:hypothetical protein